MNKKIIWGIVIIVVLIGLLFLYTNRVVGITERQGKYFNDNGSELGLCKIETKMRALDTEPKKTTYYYALNKDYVGYCKGDSTGCYISSQNKEHTVCSPVDFQKQCDKSIYPAGYGVTAKYKCVLE